MPETYFRVRWPDGKEQSCYSPSSIVADYFRPETDYSLTDFIRISESALGEASERVKQKFGYYCSSAADQLQQIRQTAARFEASDRVTVLHIHQ
ncbi:MSMEG_0570 family nitrogen starvation response protein [Ketobacter sp.]|uniref:MSMEG_0570 family nitrogen starvation response protein n=1 Tax=Ketobacter sp. TaxID=2083498 RepID=UPI000F1910EB|nr:MSMEG_0570 family nitrogen starvation response protein [Ketobacter sp.]RLT92304.1 MAG: MSMEG_0570 family nitrogen starvation response protein [Ketobacter sp.]